MIGRRQAQLTFTMLCLWLEFFLPSGVLGCTVQFRNLDESNYKLVLRLCSHTAVYRIDAQLPFQVLEAKKNTSCTDEPDDGLATSETFEEATDPFCHSWS